MLFIVYHDLGVLTELCTFGTRYNGLRPNPVVETQKPSNLGTLCRNKHLFTQIVPWTAPRSDLHNDDILVPSVTPRAPKICNGLQIPSRYVQSIIMYMINKIIGTFWDHVDDLFEICCQNVLNSQVHYPGQQEILIWAFRTMRSMWKP